MKVGIIMLNKIGYACINSELKPRTFKACRLRSIYKYGIEYLRSAILNNLSLTKNKDNPVTYT